MPLVCISLISVVLALTWFVSPVSAQKPHAVLQNPPSGQIIVTRPLAERVLTARRLLANPKIELTLPPFVLTPRRPYVEGRGALESDQAYIDLLATDTGLIAPWQYGSITVWLFHPSGKRFLVDCRVSGWRTFSLMFHPKSTSLVTEAVNGLLSFVTPLDASAVYIGITKEGTKTGFTLMGCEITQID